MRSSHRPGTPSSFSLSTRASGGGVSKAGSDIPVFSGGEYGYKHGVSSLGSPLLNSGPRVNPYRLRNSAAQSTLSHGSNSGTMLDPEHVIRNKPVGRQATLAFTMFLFVFCFSFAFAVAMPKITPMMIKYYVSVASTDSPLFSVWSNPTAEGTTSTRSFTVFNLTNPSEVLAGAEAPNYELLGPYVYEEVTVKYDISFDTLQPYVAYRYTTNLYFQPAASNWSSSPSFGPAVVPPYGDPNRGYAEEDEVLVPSLAVVGLVHRLGKLPGSLSNMSKVQVCEALAEAISSNPVGPTSVFIKLTVRQLLFGYEDELLALASSLLKDQDYRIPTTMMLQWNGTVPVPSPYTYRNGQLCPLSEIDASAQCNNTINLPTVEGTGLDDYTGAGVLSQWAGQQQLQWWGQQQDDGAINDTEGCLADFSSISATNGMRFGAVDVVTEASTLTVFADNLWRTFRFQFDQSSQVMGLQSYRFSASDEQFLSSPHTRKCYQQLHDGVMNFSQPLFAPSFVARGFFYGVEGVSNSSGGQVDASSQLVNLTMRGANGSRLTLADYINTYLADQDAAPHLYIEPNTGITVQAAMQVLLLSELRPIEVDGCESVDFPVGQRLPRTLTPYVLVEKSTQLSQNQINQIESKLAQTKLLAEVVWAIAAAAGTGCLVVVGAIFYLRRQAIKQLEQSPFTSRMVDPLCAESSVSLNN